MMDGMNSYNMQEKTGEAYELYPSAVTVNLKPLHGGKGGAAGSGKPSPEAQGAVEPVEDRTGAAQGDDGEALMKGAIGAAAVAGAVAVGTREKKWQTSSSTRTSVRPDGTVVTHKTSTSVGGQRQPGRGFESNRYALQVNPGGSHEMLESKDFGIIRVVLDDDVHFPCRRP